MSVAGAPAPLPGAVGLSRLSVYPWSTEDGLHGGSPHLHLCCSEAYVVISGRGRLQTLTVEGGAAELPLTAGDVVWFTPGTIHRAVNDGDLQVVVVMENSGLPEAGDAVLTLPAEHLRDPDAYAAATSLAGPDGRPSPERARARRDLAVAGFLELRERTAAGDTGALTAFHEAAAALVRPRVPDWRERWASGALAAAQRTGDRLDALADGEALHLRGAKVHGLSSRAEPVLGMCGFLSPYLPEQASPAG
ncbi:cupin domain-containing protein [Modestobacter italicus]|uniref:cupin domain-containing protein n=1 Tax=Modestobacter italicus (strain DSM 44449 / CECT 9708 / BC 501) TaxID=2732864 RepID=UPI001C9613B2|nr:cupin domain-containing protein [Modestobacter italicus]